MTKGTGASRTWHDDPQVWHFVFVRYLVFFGPMNLLWEIAQLPLYTLWTQAPPPSIAYAVIHCTLGDILIAVLAARRAGCHARRPPRPVALATDRRPFGLAYTAFSECINTAVRMNWAYSE